MKSSDLTVHRKHLLSFHRTAVQTSLGSHKVIKMILWDRNPSAFCILSRTLQESLTPLWILWTDGCVVTTVHLHTHSASADLTLEKERIWCEQLLPTTGNLQEPQMSTIGTRRVQKYPIMAFYRSITSFVFRNTAMRWNWSFSKVHSQVKMAIAEVPLPLPRCQRYSTVGN